MSLETLQNLVMIGANTLVLREVVGLSEYDQEEDTSEDESNSNDDTDYGNGPSDEKDSILAEL